jgi:hypothetical protein
MGYCLLKYNNNVLELQLRYYLNHFKREFFVGLTDNLLLGAKTGVGYKCQETILDNYTRFKCVLDLTMSYRF